MIHRGSLLVVLLIGLAAVLAGPGQALLPHRTLLPLDFLHEALLPWANDIEHPRFRAHYEIDAVQEYLPLYQFEAESLERGEFPTWNPFNRGGTAFVDNPVPIPFHPLKLMLRFLPPDQVFDLIAVVHFSLAFLAMSLYLRSLGLVAPAVLFGALCWAFCAFFVLNYVHERVIGAYGLLPVNLMLAERVYTKPDARTACSFGLVLGLSLLISDPTAILVYLLVFASRLLGFWLVESNGVERSRLQWLCAAAVIAFSVAAPNLLSSIEGLLTNVRVFDYHERYRMTAGLVTSAGAYAGLALSAIHPYLLGSRDSLDLLKLVGQTLTMTPFAGSFTLLVALLAMRRLWDDQRLRWLLLLFAVGLILLVPAITQVWSTRNVILLTFVLVVAGGLGVHRMYTAPPDDLRRSARLVVAFAVATWLAFLLREGILLFHGDTLVTVIRQGIESRLPGYLLERYAQWNAERADRFLAMQHLRSLPNVLFLVALAIVATAWHRYASNGRPHWRAVMFAVILAPSFFFMLDNVHVVDTQKYPVPRRPEYLALRGQDPGPPRIAIPREDLNDRLLMPALLPQLFHLGQVQGYGSLYSLGPEVLTRGLPLGHPLYEVLGVNYMITARDSAQRVPSVYGRNAYSGEVNIHAREPLASRFHVAHRFVTVASRREASVRARADERPIGERDFHITGIPPGYGNPPGTLTSTVRVLRDEPTFIEVEVSAKPGALLVIGNTYYPGWRATVDGEPAQIECVDGAVQGIWIKSTQHRVILRYTHWPSRVGLGLLLIALAASGFVLTSGRSARIRAQDMSQGQE
jgi:hypothetical protein